MFIKCPNCNTSYDIPDDYIGDDGQNVKCVSCANVWFQEKTEIKEKVNEDISTGDIEETQAEEISVGSNFLAEASEVASKESEVVVETEDTTEADIEEEVEEDSFLAGLSSLENLEDQIKAKMEEEDVSDDDGFELDLTVLDEVEEAENNIDENNEDDDLANLIKFAKSGIEIEDDNVEVDEIVSRLSKFNKQTDDIENSDDFLDKILFKIFKEKSKTMNITMIKRYITGSFIILLLLLIGVFFHGRYVITKYVPATKYVYNVLRIPAVIAGEGLEFKNVTKREYEEDYERKMEIKGFIVNKTEESIDIPLIYIELLDKDGVFLQRQVAEASIDSLTPGASTGFTVVVDSASRFAKYIVTTFHHKKGINGI